MYSDLDSNIENRLSVALLTSRQINESLPTIANGFYHKATEEFRYANA
jgi:hypothetical protein